MCEFLEGSCDARHACAKAVFEGLGFRAGHPPPWGTGIRTPDELGGAVGILFVTDRRDKAESWYGPVFEIDTRSPRIIDAIQDPNTDDGIILVLRSGEPLVLPDRDAVDKAFFGSPHATPGRPR
jgi:hypothetical protein